MRVEPIKTRLFKEGEDLVAFTTEHIPSVKDGSIIAVVSKIVALAENRVVAVVEDKETLIKKDSEWMRHVFGAWWLTVHDGTVVVNAGIDESNADGMMILLPRDSFAAASEARRRLCEAFNLKNLGVTITDSRIMPLRAGVVGVALGYAGVKGLRDYRGKKDMFGRKLKFTQTDVADSPATAAVLTMGEGEERQPLCIIDDAPVEFAKRVNRRELVIAPKDDMYRPLFRFREEQ